MSIAIMGLKANLNSPSGASMGVAETARVATVVNKQDAAQAEDRGVSERDLRKISDVLQPFQIALKFSRDEETGAIVVRVIDERSGETLRQIPPEALLRLSAALGKLQGQIFNRLA
ncbi:MAG: flagellar biosynthesis protein FlaG [Pyrinomonas sp.]|uniref:flagellar protein FlaG n=1 Tax=Pyrinomonas sp. TaxID=2080306 RepID=UPI00332CF5C0